MGSIAAQGHARRVDGLHGGDGIALDTWDLHQPANRIAREPEMMLHANLGCVLDLSRRAAQHCA